MPVQDINFMLVDLVHRAGFSNIDNNTGIMAIEYFKLRVFDKSDD